MKDLITIKHGALFPIFTRITMLFIALMLSGVMLAVPLLGGLIAILIFFPVFIYAFFSTSGTEIDLKNQKVRSYSYTFFKKRGEWKPLKQFNQITLLINVKSQRFNYRMFPGTTVGFLMYEVYLLNNTHRKKIYIHGSESKAKMIQLIKKLVATCELDYVKYSPKRIVRN